VFVDFVKLCTGPDAPMYLRDFFKLDRQDDNAALRFLSSGTLQFLVNRHPELVGPIVYLFICGEVVDAYQNRKIGHDERVKMVLRARHFLDIWEKALNVTGHPISRHCISREAMDIMRIAYDGLVATYCDDLLRATEPLLPWLHSTEICEHTFAELRKVIKDFTALDFIYLVPGMEALLRTAMDEHNVLGARAQASGYAHTWCEQRDINLAVLMIFPNPNQMVDLNRIAYEEAVSVWAALEVNVNHLQTTVARMPEEDITRLPSFQASFPKELLGESLRDSTYDDKTQMLHNLAHYEEHSPGIDTDGRLLSATSGKKVVARWPMLTTWQRLL
jgi:hypothetical protein